MGWDADRPPLEYLQRRVKYYEKKRGTLRNLRGNKILIDRYGEQGTIDMVAMALLKCEQRIKEFTKAVKSLQD